MKRLLLATGNRGKIKEITALLATLPLEVLTPADLGGLPAVNEDQETFAGNAAKKAYRVSRATGEITLADDSGLVVEALGGLPGVRSARFAGPGADDAANNRLLLKLLAGRPPRERRARFRCAIALSVPGDKIYLVRGDCPGRIAEEPRGDGGFGYDPLFIYEPVGLTFAQLDPGFKNRVSHRGRALRQVYRLIKTILLPAG